MKFIYIFLSAILFVALASAQKPLSWSIVNVPITIYDHYPTINSTIVRFSPDFQPKDGTYSGEVVQNMVSPVLNQATGIAYIGNGTVNGVNAAKDGVYSAETFKTWFKNTPGINIPLSFNIPFNVTTYEGTDTKKYYYLNNNFFPIDGKGFCDTSVYPSPYNCGQYKTTGGVAHNFHFCFQWSGYFQYKENAGLKFSFTGDDDVWVYFDNKLRIDIGAIHGANSATFSPSAATGFVNLQYYNFNFFYCERKTTGSNINIDTNIDIKPDYYDFCGVGNGDGSTCCVASRDCNDNNPCTTDACPDPLLPEGTTDWKKYCKHTTVSCPSRGNCYNNTCDATLGGCPTGIQKPLCTSTNLCVNVACASDAIGCKSTAVSCVLAGNDDICNPRSCSPSKGCVFDTPLNCTSTDKCKTYSCKGGCTSTPKALEAPIDNCDIVTCDSNTGLSVHTHKSGCTDCGTNCTQAGQKDLCSTFVCGTGNVCLGTSLPQINDGNPCTTDACNKTTGTITNTLITCEAQSLCHLPPTCDPKTGSCSAPVLKNCDDGNECTNDSCDASNGQCVNTLKVCNDNDPCTEDSCDQYTGCKATRKVCKADSLCMEGYCTNGECKVRDRVCTTTNFCDISRCNEKVGCVAVPRQCEATDSSCSTATCNYDTQECEDKPYDPLPFKCQSAAVKTGVAIGTAATAGIVIAGAVALGMAVFGGKKGYDYWKQSRDTKMSAAIENPMFEPSQNSNENPLFENTNA